MTSKYSILSVLIRPEIQEKISIGIILIDENTIHFNYSKNKLSIAKSLLSKSAFSSLKDILYSISSLSKNLEISDNKSPFSSSYLEYLSRYNNNILAYSQLKEIELSASDVNFQKLFDKYIDSTINISHIEKKPIQEATRDKNGYPLTYKNSDGDTALYTRDEQGNKVAYKNSNGYYEVKGKQVTQQEYEAFIQSLGNPDEKARKLVDKFKDFPAIIDQLLKQQEIEDNLHNKIKQDKTNKPL